MRVKVVVLDLDDNSPSFDSNGTVAGVRVNAPVYSAVAQVAASDPDAPGPNSDVVYSVQNVTYHRYVKSGGAGSLVGSTP